MLTFKRTDTKNFDLNTAISETFGKDVEVTKLFNFITQGIIAVDGFDYDWSMKVDRFIFIPSI